MRGRDAVVPSAHVDALASRLPPLSRGERRAVYRNCGIALIAPSIATSSPGDPVQMVLAGTLRLDNRDEIIGALGSAPAERGDAALALAAYRRWGETCVERMIGDFAFAVVELASRAVVCARDPFGVRPLFYRAGENAFAFASQPAVISSRGLALTEEAVAAYLAGLAEAGEATSYADVQRLLPAHRLAWRGGRLRATRYWTMTPADVRGEDPVQGFRARFERAVHDRLVGAERPAAMLSGGLDSSSVALVASRRADDAPLPVYSMVYDRTPAFDESAYIDRVLASGRFEPHRIVCDDHAPLDRIADLFELYGGPFNAAGLPKSRQLYAASAADGVDVLLDGHGGDEVAWHGSGRLSELASEGRWLRLAAQLPGYGAVFGDDPLTMFLALYSRYGPRQGPLGRTRGLARRIGARWVEPAEAPAWRRFLSADFLRRTDLEARFEAVAGGPLPPRDEAHHLAMLTSPAIGLGFELFDAASCAAGGEVRYPFYDVRLARFALGLPAIQKLRRGETRSVLRRAMTGILPEVVRTRRDKTNFATELSGGMARHHADLLRRMSSDGDGVLASCVDRGALRTGVERLIAADSRLGGDDAQFIWRAAALYAWSTSAARTRREAA